MMKFIWLSVIGLLFLPLVSAEVLDVKGFEVEYDTLLEEKTEWGDMKMYYLGEELVFSTVDSDKDGKIDSWLEYKEGVNTAAMKDSTGNNRVDYSVEFDSDGNITNEVRKTPINAEWFTEKFLENKILIGGLAFVVLFVCTIVFRRRIKRRKGKK